MRIQQLTKEVFPNAAMQKLLTYSNLGKR